MKSNTEGRATLKKNTVFSTPWFDLVAKEFSSGPGQLPHYSIETLDYVSVLALTPESEVILVRQYRPAVEKEVEELPSGHVEKNETPKAAARRELLEETGYDAADLELLGSFWPDTGRLSNRVWYFFAENSVRQTQAPRQDPEIAVIRRRLDDFIGDVAEGRFEHSLNLPAVLSAFLKKENFRKKVMAILGEKKT